MRVNDTNVRAEYLESNERCNKGDISVTENGRRKKKTSERM